MPKTLATWGSPTPSRSSIALPWCGSFNRCLGALKGAAGAYTVPSPVTGSTLNLFWTECSCFRAWACHASVMPLPGVFGWGGDFRWFQILGYCWFFYPVPHISLPLCKEGSLPRWCFGRLATSCATSTRSWIPCWVCRCALTSKAVWSTSIDSWT